MPILPLLTILLLAALVCGLTWYAARLRMAPLEQRLQEAEALLAASRKEAEAHLVAAKQEGELRLQQAKREADGRLQQVKEEAEARLATLKTEYLAQREADERLRREAFETQTQLVREQLRAQFEQEMQERTRALKEANREQMAQVVTPLQEELKQLRTLMDTQRDEHTRNTSALEASIKAVFEHDKERDKTTQSLADALKNRGKVQGDWGEQVLENILRDSGLREGEEYEKQVNVKTETGANERPDIIVKAANGSRIVIDSKVSLTAYTDYVGAESDDERRQAQKANYDSLWAHVTELAAKHYEQKVPGALPIVLMFVPNEGSYILAMNRDPQLGAKAYAKGVLIINPTNLMVVLRLMFLTWQNTRQEKNNREILQAAGRIYEKYSTFAETFLTLGNQLSTARTTYEKGLGQLREGRGNLSKQLEDLLYYGVSPSKRIPEQAGSMSNEE